MDSVLEQNGEKLWDKAEKELEWRKAWRGLGGFRIGADHVEAGLGWGRVGVEIRSGRGEVWRTGTVCFFLALPSRDI